MRKYEYQAAVIASWLELISPLAATRPVKGYSRCITCISTAAKLAAAYRFWQVFFAAEISRMARLTSKVGHWHFWSKF